MNVSSGLAIALQVTEIPLSKAGSPRMATSTYRKLFIELGVTTLENVHLWVAYFRVHTTIHRPVFRPHVLRAASSPRQYCPPTSLTYLQSRGTLNAELAMKYKYSLGSRISTLAGKWFVCTKEVVLDGSYSVKVNSTGNMPTFILVLESAIDNGKIGYLG